MADELAHVSRLRSLDLRRMLDSAPPPVPWLAEPLLARAHLTMLAGREGLGKSLLAQAVAVAVVEDADVLAGLRIASGGSVLYVDAENGEHEVHRRVRALGLSPAGVERFAYQVAEGWSLADAADFAELDALLRKHQPQRRCAT